MFSSENWFGASAGFYNRVATQSLRFDIASTSYLKRQPSASNRKTYVLSFWLKPSNDTLNSSFLVARTGSGGTYTNLCFSASNNTIRVVDNQTSYPALQTSGQYRDVSAWYHIVFAVDTTQTTNSNKLKVYVNGTEQSYGTSYYYTTNDNTNINSTDDHYIGYNAGVANLDGYLAEYNFIDGLSFFSDTSGTANTSFNINSFGETKNGVWIAKSYSGSYGTNGYRLAFNSTDFNTSGSSTMTDPHGSGTAVPVNGLADASGQGNHWTTNGIGAVDFVSDSPENNFPTWNNIAPHPTYGLTTISEGSLKSQNTPNNNKYSEITFHLDETNKYYFEYYNITTTGALQPASFELFASSTNKASFYITTSGSISVDGSSIGTGFPTLSAGDIVNIAFDGASGKLWFGKNGTYYNASGSATGNPADGSNPIATLTSAEFKMTSVFYQQGAIMNFGQDSTFAGNKTSGSENAQDSNGIGDFYDTVPSGFLALCSANLPEPTISPNADTQADDYFTPYIWTGNDTNPRAFTDVGFQADWIWIKKRSGSGTSHHLVADSTRGDGKTMLMNESNQEATNDVNGTVSDTTTVGGFTVNAGSTSDEMVNDGSDTYVAWLWKAGGTTPSKTYKVVVVSDSGNKYRFRNSEDDATFAQSAVTLDLQEGGTYRFDQSDSSNSGHPFRFSLTSNGTHGGGSEYTTGVTTNGTAGSAGAYTEITVASGVATLYYYCTQHSAMGGQVNTNTTHGSTNFDGSILSVSQTNETAGFSIVTYNIGSSGVKNVGHGLTKAPELIINKGRDSSASWWTFTTVIDGTIDYFRMNVNTAKADDTLLSLPTSSVFYMVENYTLQQNVIAYCFHSVEGYSKISTYIGNGEPTDGTFVYTGFRPAWVLIKSASAGNLMLSDSARDPDNVINNLLYANLSNAEYALAHIDYTSNGFKLRTSNSSWNGSNVTYIYMAFAENPFKYANAR